MADPARSGGHPQEHHRIGTDGQPQGTGQGIQAGQGRLRGDFYFKKSLIFGGGIKGFLCFTIIRCSPSLTKT